MSEYVPGKRPVDPIDKSRDYSTLMLVGKINSALEGFLCYF